MKTRAVIFDVYGTLLEWGPAPSDVDYLWDLLWRDVLGALPRLSLAEFSSACERVIARERAGANALGVQWPEIYWPGVACEVLPELDKLRGSDVGEFLYRQAQIWRTVRLLPGAEEALRKISGAGLLLGIASNAQPHAQRELHRELSAVELDTGLFNRSLCFWSFEHGFTKPDPHVFRLLTMRLAAHGVGPSQTLMVGDDVENDVGPAHAHGWLGWQLNLLSAQRNDLSGDWRQLLNWLGL
jgi:FMN phosphatase YigB (HAD superfamily)